VNIRASPLPICRAVTSAARRSLRRPPPWGTSGVV
jgi:hypothetical protein